MFINGLRFRYHLLLGTSVPVPIPVPKRFIGQIIQKNQFSQKCYQKLGILESVLQKYHYHYHITRWYAYITWVVNRTIKYKKKKILMKWNENYMGLFECIVLRGSGSLFLLFNGSGSCFLFASRGFQSRGSGAVSQHNIVCIWFCKKIFLVLVQGMLYSPTVSCGYHKRCILFLQFYHLQYTYGM